MRVWWDGIVRSRANSAVVRAARAARAHGNRPDLELDVVFLDDAALARLHADHLDDASPTDVITFDLSDELSGRAGELYVSAERALVEARARGVSSERELDLYVVHGVLHLCGFDDRTRAQRAAMRAAETRVLTSLGHARDASEHASRSLPRVRSRTRGA